MRLGTVQGELAFSDLSEESMSQNKPNKAKISITGLSVLRDEYLVWLLGHDITIISTITNIDGTKFLKNEDKINT